MPYYNLTALAQNSTSMLGMTQAVNTVLLGGWLGVLVLVMVFSILFLSFYFSNGDVNRAIAASGTICFIFSLLLVAMGLLDNMVVYIMLVLFVVGVAFSWKYR